MPPSESARSGRSVRSARSAYSTASHLLSPQTSDYSSPPKSLSDSSAQRGRALSASRTLSASETDIRSPHGTSLSYSSSDYALSGFAPANHALSSRHASSGYAESLPSSHYYSAHHYQSTSDHAESQYTFQDHQSRSSMTLSSPTARLDSRHHVSSHQSRAPRALARHRSSRSYSTSTTPYTYARSKSSSRRSRSLSTSRRSRSSSSSRRSKSSVTPKPSSSKESKGFRSGSRTTTGDTGRQRYRRTETPSLQTSHRFANSRTSSLTTSPELSATTSRRQPRQTYDSTHTIPRYSIPSYYGSITADESTNYDHDTLNEVIMAINMDRECKVGCAYYSAMDETLFLEDDIAMGGIESVETFLLHVEPTSVLISNRAADSLVQFLEHSAQKFDDDQTSRTDKGPYILRHLVSAQFDYDTARETLASVDIISDGLDEPDPLQVQSGGEEPIQCIGSSNHINLVRLASIINMESHLSVGCAGAVLTDLERRRAVEEESGSGEEGKVAFRIKHIKMNVSTDTMLLGADALISLQIVRSNLQVIPGLHGSNNEPRAKENLSVSDLLTSLASTTQGKQKVRQMLLRPSLNLDVIHQRQSTIHMMLDPENVAIVKSMRKLLKKLKSPKTLLLHVKKGVDRVRGHLSLRLGDWKAVVRFATVAANLHQAVISLVRASGIEIISKICDKIDPRHFLFLADKIMRTFDFEASKDSQRTIILSGASPGLDQLRQELAEVCDMLPELRDSIAREAPKWANKHILHCTVLEQSGFLIGVAVKPDTGVGVYHGHELLDDEWELVFVTEDVAYYKNQLMHDLDSQYGDLPSHIADEEMLLVMELSGHVREQEEAILAASEIYGELDSLLALASAAEKFNWVAPMMTTSNIIDIVDGRHPLQELLVPSFIPNSCNMRGGYGNIKPHGSVEEDERMCNNGTEGEAAENSSMRLEDTHDVTMSDGFLYDESLGGGNGNDHMPSHPDQRVVRDEEKGEGAHSSEKYQSDEEDNLLTSRRISSPKNPFSRLPTEAPSQRSCSSYASRRDSYGFSGSDMYDEEDVSVYEGKPCMIILTGPNDSGKSVYMKQVALIVHLAHVGSFVPAERATIGLTDRILTRILTRETVLDDQSAFMIDIKQAAFAMNFATRRSLLVVDEFGKGTTASNGSALLAAYLAHFLEFGKPLQPKVLAATHFHEVFNNGLLDGYQEDDLCLAHMDVRLDLEADAIEDQITYLHRLLPGRGQSSLGIKCAEMRGIPAHILNRADDIVEVLEAGVDLAQVPAKLSGQELQRRIEATFLTNWLLTLPRDLLERAKNGDPSIDVRGMLEQAVQDARHAAFDGLVEYAEEGDDDWGDFGTGDERDEEGEEEDVEMQDVGVSSDFEW
ncbi:muts domain V-domain-containing protein [Apiosordaria backusii]|uniref:Muts domain V-domain-containing protein n=1 Tax=Apiosordaria backusii TaxID=314023 RepID=A0AA40BNU3_9PEZI|nr:muts domain V-domain-containing protein [Apiosordaria backusii]